jgi:hypothetical protein
VAVIFVLAASAFADWDPGPGCSAASYQAGPYVRCVECAHPACGGENLDGYSEVCRNYVGDTGDTDPAGDTDVEFVVWCLPEPHEDSGDPAGDSPTGDTNPLPRTIAGGCGCSTAPRADLIQAAVALGVAVLGGLALRRLG